MMDHIGFIGVGAMGGGMAHCLLKAGFPLTVFDINPAAAAMLQEAGANLASGPQAVGDVAEIVFACLPAPAASREVAAAVACGHVVKLYIETSTIGTATMAAVEKELKAANIGLIDAPISGGPEAARSGTLSTVLSGAAADIDRVLPAIRSFAPHIFVIGDRPGQAQIAKLVNNLMSSAGKVVAFEGMVMAVAAGLDPQRVNDFVNVSTGRNMATLDAFTSRLLQLFRSRGKKSIGTKDTELFIEEAERLGIPVWTAPSVLALHQEGGAYGIEPDAKLRLSEYVAALQALPQKARE
jgi:3-hydroxyisobutyrate dehydrogenase-like beta-hydroxyacid dehydrogenase